MKTPTIQVRVFSWLMLAVIASGRATGATAADARRPNILLIVSDDMGFADVGFHGGKDIPTPHLDALAGGGVRFTDAYVSAPYCSPSRAGFLTGRYQQRFGFEFNPKAKTQGLPSSESTLGDRLKKAGYVTGFIGKWGLGDQPSHHPHQRGFDEFFGFLISKTILRGTERVNEKELLDEAFRREAEAFISTHQGKRWFLCLSFNAVHTPLTAGDAKVRQFAHIADASRRKYAAMLSDMDDAIGSVRRTIDAAGLERDTLIIFLNDNGGPTVAGTAVNASSNAPFRGGKRTLLEGGIRVPIVISWPGRIEPGVYRQPVISLDIVPTVLSAAGAAMPAEAKIDGVNLLPFLSGDHRDSPHAALFWRMGPQIAIRAGDYKLVRYDDVVDTGEDVGNRSRLTPFKVTPAKLYRLSDDASETNDLAASHPEKVRDLQSQWDRWNATLAKPMWTDSRIDGTNAKLAAP